MKQKQPTLVTGSVAEAISTFETFRKSKKNSLYVTASGYGKHLVDVSWLKAAAPTYEISDDIRDYVIPVVPIVTSDIPNRNMQGFTFKELSKFDWLKGLMIYRSFVGKMTAMEHVNDSPLCSKGIIFDASLHYVPRYDLWKTILLCGYDRTKDPNLANDILKGKRRGYSMGALVDTFECSVCGREQCNCVKGSIVHGTLVYSQCIGVNFIEASSVESPADVTAEGGSLLD